MAKAQEEYALGALGREIELHKQTQDENERLRAAMKEACDLLAERTHGSPARSPGHNARLRLEAALVLKE
jgi:hypothetical protein